MTANRKHVTVQAAGQQRAATIRSPAQGGQAKVTVQILPVRGASPDIDPYTGPYEVTPGAEAQVLETKGLRMTRNVTIAPIPNNYGRIEWDGSVLRIS